MKTFCKLFLYSLSVFLITLQMGICKVDPPNYNFSLDKFDLFMPGKNLSDIEKIYKKKDLIFKDNGYETYKFYVEHIRYKFPILVQFKNAVVTDFHARLPTYFLHDIFHQSLINRHGKQDIYKNRKEQSIYVWKNKDGRRHYYVGACTITCFPVYYAVRQIETEANGDYKPIIKRLDENETLMQPQQNEAEI